MHDNIPSSCIYGLPYDAHLGFRKIPKKI